jgi:hypothetical protein
LQRAPEAWHPRRGLLPNRAPTPYSFTLATGPGRVHRARAATPRSAKGRRHRDPTSQGQGSWDCQTRKGATGSLEGCGFLGRGARIAWPRAEPRVCLGKGPGGTREKGCPSQSPDARAGTLSPGGLALAKPPRAQPPRGDPYPARTRDPFDCQTRKEATGSLEGCRGGCRNIRKQQGVWRSRASVLSQTGYGRI